MKKTNFIFFITIFIVAVAIFVSSLFVKSTTAQVTIQGVTQLSSSNLPSGTTFTFSSGSTTTFNSGAAVTFNNNPTFTSQVLFSNGTSALPAITNGAGTAGIYFAGGTVPVISTSATGVCEFVGGMYCNSNSTIGWGSGSFGSGDTGFTRTGAAGVALGNGASGDFSGTLKLGTINATVGFSANGVVGATHAACTVSVTAITVVNGIITAITCT